MVTNNLHYWDKFGFFSGQTFLDFINTFDDLGKTRDLDALPDWNTVLHWSDKTKLLKKREISHLTKALSKKITDNELMQLHNFRELGWLTFNSIANSKQPDVEVLDALNKFIQFSYSQSTLIYVKNNFHWVITTNKINADLIRLRLGLFAAELISYPGLNNISQCHGCTGLFINHGRGIGRKWCRMSTCGNRAKIKKFRTSKTA